VAEPELLVDDVQTFYGDSYVLQGVSLSMGKGSVVAVLGRNGVGKTTLVRTVIAFTPARRGRVLFAGQDVTRLPAYPALRKQAWRSSRKGAASSHRSRSARTLRSRTAAPHPAGPRRSRRSMPSCICFPGCVNASLTAAGPCRGANSRCLRLGGP
jgi:ABC-type glutathione transport system ATPase component